MRPGIHFIGPHVVIENDYGDTEAPEIESGLDQESEE